ncbi:hypothetical protein A3K64_00415 [Candidatus Micrarchaeota archaeon RBG_16_36_9]|nr:MAG: hypothetical protein A3K64_00415 [Candidatus Micrarchaeota archaeon RBG_16_36_9]
MKLALMFSGGKDSCLALQKTMRMHDIVCLVSIISKNQESYMFHVPNIGMTKLQANCIGLPIIQKFTEGKKEKELDDLKEAFIEAKEKYKIEGIVTGAIRSVYQSTRIQKICRDLDLWCFNPLWLKDQIELLKELLDNKYTVIISGVFAYPLNERFLGRIIDKKIIGELETLGKKFKLNPAGEGGEIETTVLDAPFFKRKIEILDYKSSYNNNSGVFDISIAKAVKK